MFELEVDTSRLKVSKIERVIEALISTLGLSTTMKGTQRTLPGSVHWHLKKGRERGTLEVTLHNSRLWFSMHENRGADWVIESARELKRELERDP